MIDVGDHYRPTADGDGSDVYRVVGTGDDVVLLRLTDADGTRIHSGELRHCSRDALETDWEPAGNPDAGLTPVADLKNVLSGLYWSFRRFF
ncbi:hypothetical protein A4G99_12245 [Haladaptatus sp. R4]|uniref:hypothetical protein n=1 Tax=Haladaptatus sp. R4 TaxID=1679489 RepID=UPI0007B47744|nr:hypothetical protein [Haladaptatus sp. R4]KZN23652.1 hypothetical protein A4G99_12245 [Haladaptatus sp. R4]